MGRTYETRNKVLDAAQKLFNEQGVDQVSTNHIAAAAEISPGNLYYHYKNKEEIIRALVMERLRPAIEEVWHFAEDPTPSLEALRNALQAQFAIFWQHRYIRDHLLLMRRDANFAQGFRYLYQLRMAQYQAMTERMRLSGLLQPTADPETIRTVVEACWVLTSYWLSHLEATNTPITPAAMQRGAETVLLMLQPYLKEDKPL